MQSGMLREFVRIEAPIRNDRGKIVNWRNHGDSWAEIRGMRMDEVVEGETIAAYLTHKVRLRFIADVNSEMRIVWNQNSVPGPVGFIRPGDRILEVNSVLEDPKRRWLEIRCTEQRKAA